MSDPEDVDPNDIGALIRRGLERRVAGEFGYPWHEFGDGCGCPSCEAEHILRTDCDRTRKLPEETP